MKLSILFFLLILLSPKINAKYTVEIYTDQKSLKHANDFVHEISNLSPFNEFEIEYKVIYISKEKLKCKSNKKIERLPECRTFTLSVKAFMSGVDQLMIIKESNKYGGSGGSIPIITTSTPPRALVHEFMHTIGFGDEYIFSENEAETYCSSLLLFVKNYLNLTQIKPIKSGYPDDSFAKNKHSKDIPWYSDISSQTPISNNNNLGTPSDFNNNIGLFPAQRCLLAKVKKHLWQPGSGGTIMDSFNDPVGPLIPMTRRALLSLGIKHKNDKKINTTNGCNYLQGVEQVLDKNTELELKILNNAIIK